ncbi:MAG: hypothetical protein U5J78_06365 [Parasphingorhabdus sp.]|nr:hypothetical protein [Parasphingorhabdus sp.]
MKRLMKYHATQDVTMGYGDHSKMSPRLVANEAAFGYLIALAVSPCET